MLGDMSLVGSRPNVRRETDLYTEIEKAAKAALSKPQRVRVRFDDLES